jgi:hypothetical protein
LSTTVRMRPGGRRSQAATVGQLVADEVQAPALVGHKRHLDRPARADRPLAPTATAHRQPLLAVDPLHPLPIDRMALAAEQHMQPPVAEAPPFLRQRLQTGAVGGLPLAQIAVVGRVAR